MYKITTVFNSLWFGNFRVIPNRKLHPAAYRLYMELLKRHAFSFMPLIRAPGYHK